MQVTRTYEITFDEPNEGWLCADNLAVALHAHCKNTKFEVKEIPSVSVVSAWTTDDLNINAKTIITDTEAVNEMLQTKLRQQLSASEALYAFAGWLAARKEKTILSSSNDAAIVAELVNNFCKANELEDPRDGWEKNIITP